MGLFLALTSTPSNFDYAIATVELILVGISVCVFVLGLLGFQACKRPISQFEPAPQPDFVHQRLMKSDVEYRRRIRELVVFLALAMFGFSAAAGIAAMGASALAIYVAACGVGLEWWSTAVAVRLVTTKFTETVQTIFIATFSIAMVLAVIVSFVLALRLTQVTS